MVTELVFGCGCVKSTKREPLKASTSRCPTHGTGVVALTSGKRLRNKLDTKKLKAVCCPLNEFTHEDTLVIVDSSKPIKALQKQVAGKHVVYKDAKSLAILSLCITFAKSVLVHTRSPLVFRMCKYPDSITSMTPNGSGKYDVKKAS